MKSSDPSTIQSITPIPNPIIAKFLFPLFLKKRERYCLFAYEEMYRSHVLVAIPMNDYPSSAYYYQ